MRAIREVYSQFEGAKEGYSASPATLDLEAAIDKLTATALKVKAERDKFYDALDNILSALDDARVQLDGCSDINDHGGPNWAMVLLQLADKYEEIL